MKPIYKYTPLRFDFFENRLVRASGNRSLNDPFEARPSVAYFKSLADETNWDRFAASEEELADYIKGLPKNSPWRTLGLSQFDDYGIISLTKKPDNLLMWSHYANQHSGMIIEFDPNHEFFVSQYTCQGMPKSGQLSDVSYKRERLSEFTGFDEPYFEKSVDWAYEEEARLLVPFSKASKRLISIENLDKLSESRTIERVEIEPFSKSFVNIKSCQFMASLTRNPEVLCMYELPASAITGFIFGALVDYETLEKARRAIEVSQVLSHARLSQAEVCVKNYAVEISVI